MTDKNKGGRPALPDSQRSEVRSVRMTQDQWEKFMRLGGAKWLRRSIGRAKEPTKLA